jgi:predicted metal-dependent peptidase
MVKPLGGGGTDMGVGIKAADELTPRHGAIVVLTDGYTPWPTTPPRGPCIVVLIGSGGDVASRIPAWATVVHVS